MVGEMYGEIGWHGNPEMMIVALVWGTRPGRLRELLDAERAEMRRAQRTNEKQRS